MDTIYFKYLQQNLNRIIYNKVWRKIKNAKKYQVQYSLSKKFKKGKKYGTKTVTTANIKITIKKLNKKTYYVRIRGINGKNIGKWSKVKKITMKK